MQVKVLRPHRNIFGEKREKKKDDTYECPEQHAKALIASKMVSEVKEQRSKNVEQKDKA